MMLGVAISTRALVGSCSRASFGIRSITFGQYCAFLCSRQAGYITGGSAPILDPAITLYSNPLPHVLILTAIVVSVATSALALALIVRIREAYGSIEEDEIVERDQR